MKKRARASLAQGFLCLDFYGYVVRIEAQKPLLVSLYRDYSYFWSEEAAPNLRLRSFPRSPDYKKLPPVPSSFVTPRNIVFQRGRVSYIDYSGRALSILDRGRGTCDVFSAHRQLAHEVCYLTILSHVGKHLDRVGLHRIHALGLRCGEKGVVLMLPSGGGKTALALRILKMRDFQLLSEDSPLIDRMGHIHPFPLRIGMVESEVRGAIPSEYTERIERMEFGPKTIVDIEYFFSSLGKAAPPGLLLVGTRTLGRTCRIVRMGLWEAFRNMIKNAVIGMGLYQGLEFLFSRKGPTLLDLVPVLLSRLRNSFVFVRRSRAFKVYLGYDQERNFKALLGFIRGVVVEGVPFGKRLLGRRNLRSDRRDCQSTSPSSRGRRCSRRPGSR